MELLQLTYFCDAAKTENFSRTAEKFKVPTSNISQTVKRLEDELGVKLFRRSSNKIYLSDEGRTFYDGAKRALDALEEAKRSISDAEEDSAIEIRLLIRTCRRIVTKAIEKFKLLYPKVSFSINHNIGDSHLDYDFIISDGIKLENEYSRDFLISERIVLAARRGATIDIKRPTSLFELSDERFIALDGSQLGNTVEEICASAGFTPNIVIRTDDPFYVRKYVEMGLGIAFVPEISWRGLFSDGVSLVDSLSYTRSTSLYMRKDKQPTPKEREFRKILISTFREESGNE